ncbi:GINS complex subunit [Actinomortierella ambigua]|uniref:DNA replication complex GINS protein SLD5 n=1 Tax=Actinomortierella ambigua TaxID=1343610 RepID=A0A9P6QL52_9FUNG|nr:GINS complex subunit [Actinomortierella ambigua]
MANQFDEDEFMLEDYGSNPRPHQSRISASREPERRRLIDPEKYLEHLTQAWVNERAAPEILPYEQEAVQGLLDKIDQQLGVIDDLDEGNDSAIILLIIYQTELERVKYVLRGYLRARISKIERFGQYLLESNEMKSRLSPAEQTYVESYIRLTMKHFNSSFLNEFPPSLQQQDDVVFDRRISMVSKPNLSEAVFCRVVKPIGDWELDAEETVVLAPGQIYIFRYEHIRPLLLQGQVELI